MSRVTPLAAVRHGPTMERAAIDAAQSCLYGGKGLHAILEVSRLWHARSSRISSLVAPARHGLSWPPLFDGAVQFDDGIALVPVHDVASLDAEGAAGPDGNGAAGLDHCIATRASRFAQGLSHVLSVRRSLPDGGYERMSTLQVRFPERDQPDPLVVEEHRGLRNAAPPAEARQAVHRLMAGLASGAITPALRAVPSAGRSQATDPVREACGYDWRDPDLVANAARAWAPVMPRWLRGLDPEGMIEALASRGLIEGDWFGRPAGSGT